MALPAHAQCTTTRGLRIRDFNIKRSDLNRSQGCKNREITHKPLRLVKKFPFKERVQIWKGTPSGNLSRHGLESIARFVGTISKQKKLSLYLTSFS